MGRRQRERTAKHSSTVATAPANTRMRHAALLARTHDEAVPRKGRSTDEASRLRTTRQVKSASHLALAQYERHEGLAFLTELTPASGRRLAAIQTQWRRRGSWKTGMSGQHERRWNVGDDREGEGQLGDKPDQERAQRCVRRSARPARRSRRAAGGNEEREQVVASDALRVYKPRKHWCKKRMVEYSARELARRRPMKARRQRTGERRIGERVEVKGSRHWRYGTGGTR